MASTGTDDLRALRLDGTGSAALLDDAGLRSWKPEEGPLWVHLDMHADVAVEWLRNESGIDESIRDMLLAEATRPQTLSTGPGTFVVLRGVNLNPGADPEDMVAVRLVIEGARVVSVSRRRLMAISDTAEDLEAGRGPRTAPDVVLGLAAHLLQRLAPTLAGLEDAIDQQEEDGLRVAPRTLQTDLVESRRQVIALRRHLAPQREAMVKLVQVGAKGGFDEGQVQESQGLADQVTRHVEDLDELRERTIVTQDLLSSRQAEAINQRMLVLSVVTAIFLPLGLITGLLGINVGGIPGATNGGAFWLVCLLLFFVAGLQVLILRRMRWF